MNAVFGFTQMIANLLTRDSPSHLAVVFDAGRVTFRNEIYADYKAHRPDPPPELVPQFALIREATDALGVARLESDGYEADDLIASYARAFLAEQPGGEVVIVSSDKDLMQLIRPGVGLLDPIKQKPIGEAEVIEKFGVPPAKVAEVQALAGDSTDNVPGVPGIGVKTAASLITEYGDLETLLARAAEIKQPKRREALIEHADKARMSRRLVLLDDAAPLPQPIAALMARPAPDGRLAAFLRTQGFRSILHRLGLEGAGGENILNTGLTAAPVVIVPAATPEPVGAGDGAKPSKKGAVVLKPVKAEAATLRQALAAMRELASAPEEPPSGS